MRVLAEQELRRHPHDTLESVARLHRAGEILLVAGALTPAQLARVISGFELALLARAGTDAPGLARGLRRLSDPPQRDETQDIEDTGSPRVVPVGVAISGDRFALHLMTLACLPGRAVISAALRMHWAADGTDADLAASLGSGPHQLPYRALSAVDESGRPYQLRFHGDSAAGSDTWHGVLEVRPPPVPAVRRLDIVADDTRPLARLDLTVHRELPMTTVGASRASPGERLLAIAAEHLLAGTWDSHGPFADGHLGELTDVLRGAGLIAADSGTPGQLAELCERLGRPRHEIAAPPGGPLPERWASALTPDGAPAGKAAAAGAAGEFIPLAVVLPALDGATFALIGLASADSESVLHVAATGHVRSRPHWGTGFSWWIRDGAGGWHVAGIAEELDQWGYRDVVLRMPLVPPLPVPLGPAELTVTGPAQHAHATLGRQ